ncbi:CG33463, partial [Drosophila busckii]
ALTFTNLKCIVLHRNFAEINYCRIKAVNRTHKYFEGSLRLKQKPVDNVTVRIQLMRREHSFGYKPYFLDYVLDGCKFLRNRKDWYASNVFELLKGHTNVNHTCPFNHDILVNRIYSGNIEAGFLKYMPIPTGEYAVYNKFSTNFIEQVILNVYVKITR